MINRELIRIKVVQLTYAYYQNGEKIRRYLETGGINIVETFYTDKVTILARTGFEDFDKVLTDLISLTASKVEISKTKDAYFVDTGA